ncbi:hypothetical protein L7F22_013031 [Adiantum nelumboides]|nr:hypothetical protein [Adiantum nelumboides]
MAFPSFHGRKGENASNFLDDLEMAFLVSGRDSAEIKLRAFPLVLREEAKVWFQGLNEGRQGDWEVLKRAFLQRFHNDNNPEEIWRKLSQLQQASPDAYPAYEARFLKLWTKWEQILPEGERAPNFLQKERFLAGLAPVLREKVKCKFPDLFEDALTWTRLKDCKLQFQRSMLDQSQAAAAGTTSQEQAPPPPPNESGDPHLDLLQRVANQLDNLSINLIHDADWAGSVCDRRSTSGFMFSLGSAAISWSNRKQPTVALSSTEAEYRGATVAACEVAWLEVLLGELGIQVQRPVVIHCDNLSSIQLAQNPVFHAKTKHIELHYHFIRERILDGSIDLTFVRTNEQVADIFTKALGAEKLRRFQAMLGV